MNITEYRPGADKLYCCAIKDASSGRILGVLDQLPNAAGVRCPCPQERCTHASDVAVASLRSDSKHEAPPGFERSTPVGQVGDHRVRDHHEHKFRARGVATTSHTKAQQTPLPSSSSLPPASFALDSQSIR